MQGPEIVFGREVSSAGYCWEGGRLTDCGQKEITAANGVQALSPGSAAPRRVVYPLDTLTLARDFAGLDATDDAALLAFAGTWGPLTNGTIRGADLTRHWETREEWTDAILTIRRVLDLNDRIAEARDADHPSAVLGEFVRWTPKGTTVVFEDARLTTRLRIADFPGFAAPGSVLEGARLVRTVLVNDMLHRHGLRALLPMPGPKEPPPALYVPEDLAGAIALQAFQEITGTVHLSKCAGCGAWFDTTDRNKGVKHCRDACRVAACRKRGTSKGGKA